MKIIVRSFVVALALTGAIATTTTSASPRLLSDRKDQRHAPAPRCPLNDPNGCGINNW